LEVRVQPLSDILEWLEVSLSDNDDLVAAQSKLEEIANWLGESPFFDDYDSDAASLGELLVYLAANLRSKDKKALAKPMQEAIDGLDDFEAVTRGASYDSEFDTLDPEFKEAATYWEGLVSVLQELEDRKVLDKRPQRKQK
jgi:hypothetical protein